MPWRSFVGIQKSRFICRREIFYRSYGSSEPKDPQVVEPKTFDILQMLEETNGLFECNRASLIEYRHKGARPFGIIENGQVQYVSWLKEAVLEEIPEWIRDEANTIWWIQKCVTAKAARGRGLFPQVLRAILRIVPAEDIVMIHADTWNKASQRDIEKAGFVPFALRVTRRRASTSRFERLSAHSRRDSMRF